MAAFRYSLFASGAGAGTAADVLLSAPTVSGHEAEQGVRPRHLPS
jgi:hypothetical protein